MIVLIAWTFFRADTLHQAAGMLIRIFNPSLLSSFNHLPGIDLVIPAAVAFLAEFVQRKQAFPLQINARVPGVVRWSCYYITVLAIVFLGGGQQQFLYFQF
jgi:hypothetical protein